MTRTEALEAAAEPIVRHVRAWSAGWTPERVAENLRGSLLGTFGGGRPSVSFETDAIYVAPPGQHSGKRHRGEPGHYRITYPEAIAAASGGPVQESLW